MYANKNKIDFEQNRMYHVVYTHKGGGANPLFCIEIELLAHFLCAQGLPSSQALYKPKNGF